VKHLSWGFTIALLCVSSTLAAPAPVADVLDHVAVPEQSADGFDIKELSGLAWDEDEKLLYAVGDNGDLHHLKVDIADDKISRLEPVFSTAIEDTSGGLLSWDLANAEGLFVRNGANGKSEDSELEIAFEDGPAIGRFTAHGKFIADVKLPGILSDESLYLTSNKRLESVAELAPYGVLTAPEAHLVDEPADSHSIFSMDGRRWRFPALQSDQDSIKALEPLADGRLLVLIRTRSPNTDQPQAHLLIVDLATCGEDVMCPVVEVAISDPALVANDFEGMTQVGKGLFLIVTDSRHGGALVLFRLKL
jgi:Esterase-like activity of phytase